MATLHKLKLLALHCGAARSSPTRSPSVRFRRRKSSLLMRLGRSGSRRRRRESPGAGEAPLERRNSLRELFVTSPPPFEGCEEVEKPPEIGSAVASGVGPGLDRPGWTGLRYKNLLRRVWRPVLVTIPE